MDASSLAPKTQQLIDVFEKTTSSPGSELKGVGPLAEPDAALVKEFEAHMQGADSANGMQVEQAKTSAYEPHNTQIQNVFENAKVEGIAKPDAMEKMPTYDESYAKQELQELMTSVGQGELDAAQLFRVQYLTGMFGASMKGGQSITQNSARNVDVLLKQQG